MKFTPFLLGAALALPCTASFNDGTVLAATLTPSVNTAETLSETEDYAVSFDKTILQPHTQSKLFAVSLTIGKYGNKQRLSVPMKGTQTVYNDLTDQMAEALIGEDLKVNCDYSGLPLHAYLYIDFNLDGKFDSSDKELVSYTYYEGKNSEGKEVKETVSPRELPMFKLSESTPAGVYRARVKIDRNNIDPAGSPILGVEGGFVTDFLIHVRHTDGKLDLQTVNGSIVGEDNYGVPQRIAYKTSIRLMPVAIAEGYVPSDITIRHGQKVNGPQYIHGTRQWEEYTIPFQEVFEIPADKVNGDVRVSLAYEATDAAEYTLQFCDEFNQPDGSMPSEKNWVRCNSWGSTWDRTNAQTPQGQKETAYIEDGKLVALCIKNTHDDERLNDVRRQMISGAVESHGKFDFTYGKVEGRLATHGHEGNFPAFWMMPSKAEHGSWPMDGEIDIFEQIDREDCSYHTVHSNWTYNMGMGNSPAKGGTSYTQTGEYHVYTFEWTENKLTWYTDGLEVFSYAKSRDPYALENLQWPFYKDFYLILNQSVGNGSWARPCDVNHVYRTNFDWVRVYQKGKPINPETGLTEASAESDLDVYGFVGKVRLVAVNDLPVRIVDLQGRTVYSQVIQGNVDVALQQGLYIVNGKKVLVR